MDQFVYPTYMKVFSWVNFQKYSIVPFQCSVKTASNSKLYLKLLLVNPFKKPSVQGTPEF